MLKTILLGVVFFVGSFYSFSQIWEFSEATNLKGEMNAELSEENMPVFSKDSSILYFVRTFDDKNKGNEFDQDIWYSVKEEDGSYSSCKQVKEINNKFNNAVIGVNNEGTRMYLLNSYDGKKDETKGIAVSTNKGGKWGTPKPILIPTLDIEGDFFGFHVSEDEKTIIISYLGPNSLGEEDLYVSTKTGETWSEPTHMGLSINSTGFEISPFLSKNQDTLFFSSNGFGGEGDADIFYSIKQGSWSDWSTPKNLGTKINSSGFDAYFIIAERNAYWSSNRGAQASDIYTAKLLSPPVLIATCISTNLTSYQSNDGVARVQVEGGVPPFTYRWANDIPSEEISNLSIGEYYVNVGDSYGQTASATCLITEPEKKLDPVLVSTYVNLDFKHLFGYNKNKLTVKRGDLKKFVKEIEAQLKDGRESITISITSSASNVPTKKFSSNEELAKVRAENMKYDLISYFEKKKLSSKVNIVISTSSVGGPAYKEDAKNKEKYSPFQYVTLVTE